MITTRVSKGRRSLVLAVLVALLTAGLVTVNTSPAFADATPILAGTSWLDGQGVNVCGSSTQTTCGGETHVGGVSGNWYQCVELAQRLYHTRGWYTANGGVFSGVSNAYDIYDNAASLGMTRELDGSITRIVPGDMIVHTSADGGGAGHVAVVDFVNGSTVYAVEENSSTTGRATYSLSGGTLSRTSDSNDPNIYGVVHDSDNNDPDTSDNLVFQRQDMSGSNPQLLKKKTGGTITAVSSSLSLPEQDLQPDVSPDGTKVVFVGNRWNSNNTGTATVPIVRNTDGSGSDTKLVNVDTAISNHSESDSAPVWSPDGTKVAYVEYTTTTGYRIAVRNADGSGYVQLTSGGVEFWPTWSPTAVSGHYRIAYESDNGSGAWYGQIHVMLDNGTDDHLITGSDTGHQDVAPVWSPNGQRVYFSSTTSPAGIYYLKSTDWSGAGTGNVQGPYRLSGPFYNPGTSKLKISSDGRRLTYALQGTGYLQVYKLSTQTADLTLVTNNNTGTNQDDAPTFAP